MLHRNARMGYVAFSPAKLISVKNQTKKPLEINPGGTTLYNLCRYVQPHQVGFLRRFGLKTGIYFAYFGLESGMVFEGTTGAYERIYFQMNKERSRTQHANSKCIRRIFLFAH